MVATGALLLSSLAAWAYPRTARELVTTIGTGDLDSSFYSQLELFPHQVAVCDLICTGMVLSTNDGWSACFSVDEILWGHVSSTNITLRCVDTHRDTNFLHQGRYLILAFTNNWWTGDGFIENKSFAHLYDYITPTSRPSSCAVFDDYRILSPRGGAISFEHIIFGGMNYWEGTRTFITNFNDIARIQHSERNAYVKFYYLNSDTNLLSTLPVKLGRQLFMYKRQRYDIQHLPPPEEMPE